MSLKHWLLIWACVVFVIACGVIGQKWEDHRLESESGTIPPLEISR